MSFEQRQIQDDSLAALASEIHPEYEPHFEEDIMPFFMRCSGEHPIISGRVDGAPESVEEAETEHGYVEKLVAESLIDTIKAKMSDYAGRAKLLHDYKLDDLATEANAKAHTQRLRISTEVKFE